MEVGRAAVHSENVVAIWPGTDPALRKEYIGLSGHLDHLGIGKPVHGDAIFNGAMDNATGVASLIEIANALGRSHTSTKRSIAFMVFSGEEQGMLGSRYLAAHFPAPGRVVADMNMDMYLPLFPLKYLEVQGLGESTLGDDIKEIARSRGIEVQADKEPDRNRFIRSDQYSFTRQGAPSLAFKFGYIPGTPEDTTYHEWFRSRYHAVGDDTAQPVDPTAAAQFNALLLTLAEHVANEPNPPAWHSDSFFRTLH
jgi:Zn-dependent M28 family amino/carboxypeptidase